MKTGLPERTFDSARRVVNLCRFLPERSSTDRTLASQLLRSATSIGANVEEAQSGQSRADFASKMMIACKESRETHYWLRLLVAGGTLPEKRLASPVDESDQIAAILTAIVKSARKPLT